MSDPSTSARRDGQKRPGGVVAAPGDDPPGTARPAAVLRVHGNAYNIFILVLTVFSLVVMVLQLLPVTPAEEDLLRLYDNVVCGIFLIDFGVNLAGSRPRSAYLVGQRGWLDLLGSIPSLGFIPFTALFRLARLSRLARITRLLRGQAGKDLVLDVLKNRGEYATFITILLAGIVLSTASILVLEVESRSPDGNIKTAGDAIWWGIVTITTVGYGDRYPVTLAGRIIATFVMFAGIGIIGALASILASLLVAPAGPPEPAAAEVPPTAAAAVGDAAGAIAEELAGLRAEVAALRTALEAGGR
jgi:voltage-gated potassium channel